MNKDVKSKCVKAWNRYCKTSKGEIEIGRLLGKNKIFYETQKTFNGCKSKRNLKYDFYVPSANLLIEYDGEQHFKRCTLGKHYMTITELRKVQRRDRIKTDYAKKQGIRLLRIAYTDFSRINDILTSHLTNA